MSPFTGTKHTHRTRRVVRASGPAAAALFAIGLAAQPATAMPDPPAPSPDPWNCVDLARVDASAPAPVARASGGETPTEAAAILGGIGGVVLTGGAVGLVALGRRHSKAVAPRAARGPHVAV